MRAAIAERRGPTLEASRLPSSVREVVQAPGRPLDATTVATFRSRFGHDFSRVRVHSDASAARSAHAVGAAAYTVGRHVVMDDGLWARDRVAGGRVLAHELAHVAQQETAPGVESSEAAAEGEAEAWSASMGSTRAPVPQSIARRPVAVHRLLPKTEPAPALDGSATPSAQFAETVRRRFGVLKVRAGTMEEQQLPGPGGTTATPPGWQSWVPNPLSDVYRNIIEAIEDFEQSFGGVPVIDEIVFFNLHYESDPQRGIVPNPDVAGSFGGRTLTLYRAIESGQKALPVARSNAKGEYPLVILGVTGIPGQSPGAPLPAPSRAENQRRIVVHELGHGLAQAAMAADPGTFAEFKRAIGWWGESSRDLFDIGDPAVEAAFNATPPRRPTVAPITEDNWNSPQWHEQPISGYATTSPGDDFADSVMAFVYQPALLRARSSRRFDFFAQRRKQWEPNLLPILHPGDSPAQGATAPV